MAISGRTLRRTIAPWLPESLKASFRGRLFGYGAAHAPLAARFAEDPRGPFAIIDERLMIRYRDEDRDDFTYQFVQNGDSADEMAGFLRAAEGARTFVDVGAWKGIFSLLFCSMRRDNRAIAYEPSPEGRAAIDALAAANAIEAICVRPVAVGAATTRVAGRLAPNGTYAVGGDESAGAPIGEIDAVSLDDDVAAVGAVPEILKIDVEGYEYEVLVGARRLLARHKPTVCLELHLDLLERRGIGAAAVLDELASHGYQFVRCTGAALTARQICGSPQAILRFIAR